MERKIINLYECEHKYKVKETWEGTTKSFFSREKIKVFILECEKCGEIKQRWVSFPIDSREVIR